MQVTALIIVFSLTCGCLVRTETHRQPRSWNLSDLAQARDETQWLQDSAGFGFYVSTNTMKDVTTIYARLRDVIRPIIDIDAELLILESDHASAFVAKRHQKPYICVTVPMVILLGNDLSFYAALLAHEVAHLAWKHQEETGQGWIILNALGFELITSKSPAMLVAPFGLEAINRPYSGAQEQEADALAIELMAGAHFDARIAIHFHEKLHQYQSAVSSFMFTHPTNDERIRNIRRISEANKSKR